MELIQTSSAKNIDFKEILVCKTNGSICEYIK